MGLALRKDSVVTPNVWEAYLLHQTEIVGELVKQLGDFAESNSAVLLGGETMEKNIVPGSGAYMVQWEAENYNFPQGEIATYAENSIGKNS